MEPQWNPARWSSLRISLLKGSSPFREIQARMQIVSQRCTTGRGGQIVVHLGGHEYIERGLPDGMRLSSSVPPLTYSF
jgi:hypothetical protein